MTKFHADCYIKLLRAIRPENTPKYARRMQRFNVGGDCPIFEGLYKFCQLSSGGTIAAAAQLNKKDSDICINWSGGLHHAKKSRASGFCYVNDVVLGILELLKYHHRVLYIDIDVHHGDGVEEAFYATDRVMTVSFHKFGEEYFPGTGALSDIGAGKGKYYAINVPLNDGMDDESYEDIFVPIVSRVIETFQPNAVVLQCGADSLTGDRLGCFNLTIHGHGKCVEFVKKFNLPLLLLGGGGYTLKNVARLWTYETSIALGVDIVNDIPYNDYLEYYGPDYKLHSSPSNMTNENTKKYLQDIKERVFENIRMLPHAPGVQFQVIPKYNPYENSDNEHEIDKDVRMSQTDIDRRIAFDNEFSDSEDEGQGGRRNNHHYKNKIDLRCPEIIGEIENEKQDSTECLLINGSNKCNLSKLTKENDGIKVDKHILPIIYSEKSVDANNCDDNTCESENISEDISFHNKVKHTIGMVLF